MNINQVGSRAHYQKGTKRRVPVDDTDRYCPYKAGRHMPTCDTKLSRYNVGDYCWTHTPRRVPRTRGVKGQDC